jgi:hypothetical protein
MSTSTPERVLNVVAGLITIGQFVFSMAFTIDPVGDSIEGWSNSLRFPNRVAFGLMACGGAACGCGYLVSLSLHESQSRAGMIIAIFLSVIGA